MTDTDEVTYADRWADPINETYPHAWETFGENMTEDEIEVALRKAAAALRNGKTVELNGDELDAIRHLLPAHEVHQSGTALFVNRLFGFPEGSDR